MKRQDKVYIEIDGYSKKPFKLLDENNKPRIIDKKDIQKIWLQAINKSYIKTFNHLTIGK